MCVLLDWARRQKSIADGSSAALSIADNPFKSSVRLIEPPVSAFYKTSCSKAASRKMMDRKSSEGASRAESTGGTGSVGAGCAAPVRFWLLLQAALSKKYFFCISSSKNGF